MVESDHAKILRDFQMLTDKKRVARQPSVVMAAKVVKKSVVIDLAVPNDSKKEHYKLEKYRDLTEQLERTWGVKTTVIPMVISTLGAVTAKLEEQHLRSLS